MKSISLLFFMAVITATAFSQPVTGLSGWSIFLDQGHSQTENQGLYNYSEAEKVLRIGLHLRQMLLEQTDIDTVYVARSTDNDNISLSQRTDLANFLGASFYYSIHSNAGAPATNNTLMLWGANGQGVEKTPIGGKKMGDIMIQDLTASMRIPTIGSRADSPFYGATTRTTPYLWVNRASNMASVLSEGGFHTNPTQQQRNLNAEWKKLEAQSAFWSILRYHGLSRPKVGILTGITSNVESGRPINGATITVGDRTYTTDTFESLFNRYSTDPNELANGFYYLEDFIPGASLDVSIAAPGFYPIQRSVNLNDTTFTFLDVPMVSSVPPSIVSFSAPKANGTPMVIRFSRPMHRDSTLLALSITPALNINFTWIDDLTLVGQADHLQNETEYTVSISTSAEDHYEHKLASPYSTVFLTAPLDVTPPNIVYSYPANYSYRVEQQPILSFMFDERLDPTSVNNSTVTLEGPSGPISGTVRYFERGTRSVIQFYPSVALVGNTPHHMTVNATVLDVAGNQMESALEHVFVTGESVRNYTSLASFDAGVAAWWVPQQSGSTTGIVTEQTSRTAETTLTNPITGSTGSMKLAYGWIPNAGSWLIRQYLPPTPTGNNPRFTSSGLLETYVFGDASGNLFRFMVRDANGHLEGSPWTTIDWLGWKRVQWDMRSGQAVAWVGGANGVLDGTLYTDSFQMTYGFNGASSGDIYIDDYRFVSITSETTSIETKDDGRGTMDEFALLQNYPNPFNPSTQIRFSLLTTHHARLTVYDILGREVAVLVDGMMQAGTHQTTFDGSNLSSGVYLVRLQAGDQVRTMRMLLMK